MESLPYASESACGEYFCAITLLSLYGEYVVDFLLWDVVFLLCDHGLDFLLQLR